MGSGSNIGDTSNGGVHSELILGVFVTDNKSNPLTVIQQETFDEYEFLTSESRSQNGQSQKKNRSHKTWKNHFEYLTH